MFKLKLPILSILSIASSVISAVVSSAKHADFDSATNVLTKVSDDLSPIIQSPLLPVAASALKHPDFQPMVNWLDYVNGQIKAILPDVAVAVGLVNPELGATIGAARPIFAEAAAIAARMAGDQAATKSSEQQAT